MRKSLLLLASLLLFSLFFYLAGGEKTNKLDVHLKSESFFEGLKIIQRRNGEENWVLTARRADISKDGSEADLTDVEMTVKNRGLKIYAETGLYDLNTKKISIEGKVTANSKNYSMTTGQVEIDSASGLLRTDEGVTIKGRNFLLEGKGMEIKNNDQQVRILKDVKATFNN
jgi:LPS export ABC transporter protein LptC